MCIAFGGGGGPTYPSLKPRDTSQELIKSNYELSEENKKRNESIMMARNKAKSLISTEGSGPSNLAPNYQVGTSGLFRPRTFEDKTGLSNVG